MFDEDDLGVPMLSKGINIGGPRASAGGVVLAFPAGRVVIDMWVPIPSGGGLSMEYGVAKGWWVAGMAMLSEGSVYAEWGRMCPGTGICDTVDGLVDFMILDKSSVFLIFSFIRGCWLQHNLYSI